MATTAVRAVAFSPTDEGLTGEIVTRRATTITLPDTRGGQVTVNGVVIPTSNGDAGTTFLLPAEGAYSVTVGGQR
jgi:hypothetical protein